MSSRPVFAALFLLVAAAMVACWCELPLIWDGGFQLALTLIEQEPFFHLTRFHSWALWWPVVGLSRATDHPLALVCAYGLPFLLAPAVSVAASWWFVRQRMPGLIVWPLFGIAASLPGQVFVINDSIWQQTLAWPVCVGACVALSPMQRALWLALAVFQWSHQAGVLLLGFVCAAAWWQGERSSRGWSIALCALALAKVVWVSVPAFSGALFDAYAAQEATMARLIESLQTSVFGYPLLGLLALWLAAWQFAKGRANRFTMVLIGFTAIVWIVWAAWPGEWLSAINYRRWAIPAAGPFFLAAILDARRGVATAPGVRSAVVVSVAVLFAIVLTQQSLTWRGLLRRFDAEVRANGAPIIHRKDLACLAGTVLDHWGLTTIHMVRQGRTPAQYLAYALEDSEALSASPPSVKLWSGRSVPVEPGPGGWFDHRPLRERWRRLRESPASR
jgi:hypothetical protein